MTHFLNYNDLINIRKGNKNETIILKNSIFLFALLSLTSLGFGIYHHDVIIMAIGILFCFAAIIISLELKKHNSNPFRRD